MSTFKPGDRVRVTESGFVAFTRGEPPIEHVRPKFIEHVRNEKDRSFSIQESATAQTEIPAKESVMTNFTTTAYVEGQGTIEVELIHSAMMTPTRAKDFEAGKPVLTLCGEFLTNDLYHIGTGPSVRDSSDPEGTPAVECPRCLNIATFQAGI